MDIVNPEVERYLRELFEEDHPVAAEMEARAEEHGFPIVGRLVGTTLEVLARSIGARRVFEMGSGYGYSAYWFSRAVGDGGEVRMTEGDPENQRLALDFLDRAGFGDRVRSHVGDAVELIDETPGEFDVVFCDIDKHGYPEAWSKARERIRVGGLYLCDNVLWSGRVAQEDPDDKRPEWTAAIREHNAAVAADERYRSTVVPTRDGVMVALRVS
ncbi:MAG TPA: O-methyltransferase [Actinomycetota bacterium]|nr:O-methyltransferase [Actinomycetota bacterium]